jgi:hypothetical protein
VPQVEDCIPPGMLVREVEVLGLFMMDTGIVMTGDPPARHAVRGCRLCERLVVGS